MAKDISQSAAPIRSMTKATLQRLYDWYVVNQRNMPWRGEIDPYKIWVSEMMLQQTQVKTVIPYYERWLREFSTVRKLACASEQAVLKQWEGLGYYARARNFHRAAKIVDELWGGRVPNNYDDFIALPGVGPYAAAAVLSIAYGAPHAVVDGNVKRVFARYFGYRNPIETASSARWFRQTADACLSRLLSLTDGLGSGDYNQSIMELGATVCKPKTFDCVKCPLTLGCVARKTKTIGDLPMRTAKKALPVKRYLALVIIRSGHVLLRQRQYGDMLAGLWDFPLIEITTRIRETDSRANNQIVPQSDTELGLDDDVVNQLVIERLLDLGLEADSISPAMSESPVNHSYTHFKIELWPCVIDLEQPIEQLSRSPPTLSFRENMQSHSAIRWEHIDERTSPMPKSTIKVWSQVLVPARVSELMVKLARAQQP